jgi:predicted PurR-regulated permease PerM
MKGVIVQVGEPKSIVLFNNGKISAIPTPADCHVGMVVTVKYNNKLKILAITLAAVLLVGAGVFIGVSLVKDNATELPTDAEMMDDGTPGWQRGQKKMQEVERKFSE